MLIVAGLSLKNLKPAVWEQDSPYYIPNLQAVMVSYADFHAMSARRKQAMQIGLHALLGVPQAMKIYLDNGAFYFLGRDGETPRQEYEEFVALAKPDWWPSTGFIPAHRNDLNRSNNSASSARWRSTKRISTTVMCRFCISAAYWKITIEAFAANDRLASRSPRSRLEASCRIFSARPKRSHMKRSCDTSSVHVRPSPISAFMCLALEEPLPCTWLRS